MKTLVVNIKDYQQFRPLMQVVKAEGNCVITVDDFSFRKVLISSKWGIHLENIRAKVSVDSKKRQFFMSPTIIEAITL